MPNGLRNWKFRDAERFLKKNKFSLNHTNGSHFYYTGHVNKVLKNVCVPYHGSKSIKPRTLKGIILQSGISKKEWLK